MAGVGNPGVAASARRHSRLTRDDLEDMRSYLEELESGLQEMSEALYAHLGTVAPEADNEGAFDQNIGEETSPYIERMLKEHPKETAAFKKKYQLLVENMEAVAKDVDSAESGFQEDPYDRWKEDAMFNAKAAAALAAVKEAANLLTAADVLMDADKSRASKILRRAVALAKNPTAKEWLRDGKASGTWIRTAADLLERSAAKAAELGLSEDDVDDEVAAMLAWMALTAILRDAKKGSGLLTAARPSKSMDDLLGYGERGWKTMR